jgi:hypothetical protein
MALHIYTLYVINKASLVHINLCLYALYIEYQLIADIAEMYSK